MSFAPLLGLTFKVVYDIIEANLINCYLKLKIMTHENSSSEGQSDPSKVTTKKWGGSLTVVGIIIVLAIILKIFSPEIKEYKKENKGENNKKTQNEKGRSNCSSVPTHEPNVFTIDGTWSELKQTPVGFDLSFGCSENYEIMNSDGQLFKGKAYHNVDIGWLQANLFLRFRTSSGKSTSMTINYVYDPTQGGTK